MALFAWPISHRFLADLWWRCYDRKHAMPDRIRVRPCARAVNAKPFCGKAAWLEVSARKTQRNLIYCGKSQQGDASPRTTLQCLSECPYGDGVVHTGMIKIAHRLSLPVEISGIIIIIIDTFYTALFSGLHKLAALYNILRHVQR